MNRNSFLTSNINGMDWSVNLTHTYTAWTRAWIEHMTYLDRSLDRTHDLHGMDPNMDRSHDLHGPEHGSNTLNPHWKMKFDFPFKLSQQTCLPYEKDTYKGNKIGVTNRNIFLAKYALRNEVWLSLQALPTSLSSLLMKKIHREAARLALLMEIHCLLNVHWKWRKLLWKNPIAQIYLLTKFN